MNINGNCLGMEGQKRLQALFLALKEKYKESKNMMKKVEEKSLVWWGKHKQKKGKTEDIGVWLWWWSTDLKSLQFSACFPFRDRGTRLVLLELALKKGPGKCCRHPSDWDSYLSYLLSLLCHFRSWLSHETTYTVWLEAAWLTSKGKYKLGHVALYAGLCRRHMKYIMGWNIVFLIWRQ